MQSTTAVLHLLCALTLLHCSATAGVIRDDTSYTSAGIKVQQSVPTRPNVSEIFLTWMIVEIDYFVQGGKTSGTGFWARNLQGHQAVNVTIKNVEQQDKEQDLLQAGPVFPGQVLYQLQRCEDNSTYFNTRMKNQKGNGECVFIKECNIANLWQWLDKAVYQGRKEWIDHELDVWEAEIAPFTTASLGVPPSYPSRPVLYQEMDVKFGIALGIQFVDFLAIDPPQKLFDVPNFCSKQAIKNRQYKDTGGTPGGSLFKFLYPQ